ncbi:MAG TPA: carboxymuconolactone decarboxylase family protein [Gammaproteobacteria bacterium]
MSSRVTLDPQKYAGVIEAMRGLKGPVRQSGLDPALIELVKVRASQVNGCAFCLDMHTREARARGETEQRLYLLNAWRDANVYTPRERAALAWTEAVTRLEHHEVPDAVYELARAQFSEEELVALTLAVVEINGWNRFSIAFRRPPGSPG